MIFTYGMSIEGPYHTKNGIVCQDSNRIRISKDRDYCIAAIADGVGSALHSDVASKIAADQSVDYCFDKISPAMPDIDIQRIIKESFTIAKNAIEKEANYDNLDQYDTTLSLAVYLNDTLHYGHSGDGGIVALTLDGLYKKVTEQKRFEDKYVYPLSSSEQWVFGTYEEKVASVLLATDGVYEALFPVLIRNQPINIYVALVRYFMDNELLQINDEKDEQATQEKIFNFLADGKAIEDDKTIVCLVNTSLKTEPQPDSYYAIPNWDDLEKQHKEELNRILYSGTSDIISEIIDSDGREHKLEKKVLDNDGWEIFSSSDFPDYGIKIFKKPDTNLENRINSLTNKKITDQYGILWPLSVAYKPKKQFCGYVIYLPKSLNLNDFVWLEQYAFDKSIVLEQRLEAAKNLCKLLKDIEKLGYDVNSLDYKGVMIDTKTDKILFTDIDALTTTNDGKESEHNNPALVIFKLLPPDAHDVPSNLQLDEWLKYIDNYSTKPNAAESGLEYDDKNEYLKKTGKFISALEKSNEKLSADYFSKAKEEYIKGNFNSCIENLNSAIASNPSNAGYYSLRGKSFFKKDKYKKAEEDFKKFRYYNASMSKDEDNDVSYYLGVISLINKTYDENYNPAISLLEKGTKTENAANAYFYLGYIYFKKQIYKHAIENFEKCLDKGPTDEKLKDKALKLISQAKEQIEKQKWTN
jgi:tetratricopeptide (TPR) repeat protein